MKPAKTNKTRYSPTPHPDQRLLAGLAGFLDLFAGFGGFALGF